MTTIIHPGRAGDNYYTANDIITLLELDNNSCVTATWPWPGDNNAYARNNRNRSHFTAAMADKVWQQRKENL